MIWDNLLIALQAIRANKMRSLLTMLGIIVGVASVITMVAVGAGAQTQIAEQIRSHMFLAHVRAATGGTPVQQTNCHPFRHENWMMVHNGLIRDFAAVKRDLALEIRNIADRPEALVPSKAGPRGGPDQLQKLPADEFDERLAGLLGEAVFDDSAVQGLVEEIKTCRVAPNTIPPAVAALHLAHRGYVMENGAIALTDTAENLMANDDVLAAVMNAGTGAVCLVGKTHDFHVTTALGVTLDENRDAIAESWLMSRSSSGMSTSSAGWRETSSTRAA